MHNKQELDRRMKEAGIQPLKKLGQNFLLNPKISIALINAVKVILPASLVEIGPGLGALTDDLILGDWQTILIEMDSGLVKYWHEKSPNAKIIHKDALQINWSAENFKKPCVLVSNLPYSIAASLVVELSSLDVQIFDAMVLMFQKEVAERITSRVFGKDYGMLSVVAQAHWQISTLIDAGPQDFFPVPNVGSRVLKFVPSNLAADKETKINRPQFTSFVKQAFSQRRKKLISNLSARYDRSTLEQAMQMLGIGDNARAQELDCGQFAELFVRLA